jgi:hypothetical protein
MLNTQQKSVSVSEMAVLTNLSRSRFYQLIEQGVFPQPVYCVHTKRPYYDAALQFKCIEIKESGIGENGKLILFYRSKKVR